MKKVTIYVMTLLAILILGGCDTDAGVESCTETTGVPFDNVHVVDASLILLEGDANGSHYLALSKSSGSVEEDDILVFGVSTRYPHGNIHKVLTAKEQGGIYLLETEPAGLGSIFQELQLCQKGQLQPEDMIDRAPGELESKHTLFDFDYTIDKDMGHGVSLTGEMDFSIGYDLAIKHKWGGHWYDPKLEIKHGTHFVLDSKVTTQLTAKAEEEYHRSWSRTLYSKNFKPITVWVGEIPVVIVPKLDIIGHTSVDLDAVVQTSASAELDGGVGLRYNGHHWRKVEYLNRQFHYSPPALDASANLYASVGPKLTLKVYDIAGPYADLDGFGELDADINANPWWNFYVGVVSHGGFKMRILHHTLVNVHKELFRVKKRVAHANGPLL